MSLSIQSFARALAVVSALAAPATLLASSAAHAQVGIGISVNFGPPALPVYVQPPLPSPGYVWVPGYWSWDGDAGDYYWVPGYWSQPPGVGLLWTPGYWGWNDGAYLFHRGYWGPTVGFYGGINYGFGYNGIGFFGGRWDGDRYNYNRSVTNVTNVNVTNVYNQQVVNNNTTNVSYNGGKGGAAATPTPQQVEAAKHPQVVQPTAAQLQHEHAAQAIRSSHFSANQGKPAVAAVTKPGELTGPGVVRAKTPGAPAPDAPKVEPKPAGAKTAEPKPGAPNPGGPKAAEPKAKAATPVTPAPHPDKAVARPNNMHPLAPAPHPVVPTPHPMAPVPHPAPVMHAPPPQPHPAFKPAPRPAPGPRPGAAHPACPDPKKCH